MISSIEYSSRQNIYFRCSEKSLQFILLIIDFFPLHITDGDIDSFISTNSGDLHRCTAAHRLGRIVSGALWTIKR